ncbi:MAG: phosphopantothenate/pantothenate synthetase [Spirochaetales bacterium]
MLIEIPTSHPRYASLMSREKIVEGLHSLVVTESGLIAHGRGESLDYFLGEATADFGREACRAAAAKLLLSSHPVISVNGNAAALVAAELVELSKVTGARLEVNLFYRKPGREEAVEAALRAAGATEVLGVGDDASAVIDELQHARRIVSPRGILIADTVLVPLEDGDRTEALVKLGKTVLTIDLNPLSRTSKMSHLTIVDNILRALPLLVSEAGALKNRPRGELEALWGAWDNRANLAKALKFMADRLYALAGEQK